MKTDRRVGWIPAAALAVAVAVLLPLQTYLGNAEIYPFSALRLLPELLLLSAVIFLGLWLVERLSSVLHLHLFSPLLYTSLLFCVYLESGPLSLGIPELNGGFIPMLSSVSRGIIDVCVWGVTVFAFGLCVRWLKPFAHWISLAVLVLMLASLADVRSPSTASSPLTSGLQPSTSITSGFESQPTVVANVRYSPTRNILVFILDSMPGLEAAELVRTNALLRAKFPGFTAYPNNIGMHECTKRGVPGLVTGRHYDPKEMSEQEYPMTMYGTNSFVTAAVRDGWNVAFSPDLLPYGFTNLPVEKRVARVEKPRSRDVLACLRQSKEVPYLSLFDLTAFRLSPFFFKGPILYSRTRHAVKGRHSNEDFWGEGQMYPQLAARPTDDERCPFLGVFHSWGAHPPWEIGLTETIVEKLERLGVLMDSYRERGLYATSTIIVTTDHALAMTRSVKGYPPSASALLWVKSEGAEDPFAISPTRTSHARVAALVRDLLQRPLSAAACESVLSCERPLFRAEVRDARGARFKDWNGSEE